MSYVLPPPAFVLLVLSKVLVEHVTGQFRHLLLVAPCWVEASYSSQHVDRHFSLLSCCTKSYDGCFNGPGTQRSVITALTVPFQGCVLWR